MKARSIPFSFGVNRGPQKRSSGAAGPQICIMKNRNSVRFWVLAKSFRQKRDLRGCVLDTTLNSIFKASSRISRTGLNASGVCVEHLLSQNRTELRFFMMQICGPAAPELRFCRPRLTPNENGMLRAFIPAGSAQPSGGPRDPCNRERLYVGLRSFARAGPGLTAVKSVKFVKECISEGPERLSARFSI